MKQTTQTLRIAIVALSASAALSTAPVYGQDAAPVTVAPPPPPVASAPPPANSLTPPAAAPVAAAPALRTAPAPTARAAPSAEPAARRATRTVERSRAPAARSAPAASTAPSTTAPTVPATTGAPTPAPAAETPPPAPAATAAPPPNTGGNAEISEGGSNLPWLIAGGVALLLAAIGFLAWRRRRAAEEVYEEAYEEVYYDEPYEEQVVAEPVADIPYRPEASDYQSQIVSPVPAFQRETAEPRHEPEVALRQASDEDLEVLAAASDPDSGRPWLEFLMRPVRAGTSGDDALVEFELTVGNTGSAPAEDVRISTWMLAGDASEMESSLIEPPAAASTSETRIEAGDGTRVEARIAVPREQLAGDRLPVVVADARYRLPDGGEGRTAARFAVGLPSGDGLAPFAVELGDGLRDDVEVRLDGEPERV